MAWPELPVHSTTPPPTHTHSILTWQTEVVTKLLLTISNWTPSLLAGKDRGRGVRDQPRASPSLENERSGGFMPGRIVPKCWSTPPSLPEAVSLAYRGGKKRAPKLNPLEDFRTKSMSHLYSVLQFPFFVEQWWYVNTPRTRWRGHLCQHRRRCGASECRPWSRVTSVQILVLFPLSVGFGKVI